jgi:hypothetical protein
MQAKSMQRATSTGMCAFPICGSSFCDADPLLSAYLVYRQVQLPCFVLPVNGCPVGIETTDQMPTRTKTRPDELTVNTESKLYMLTVKDRTKSRRRRRSWTGIFRLNSRRRHTPKKLFQVTLPREIYDRTMKICHESCRLPHITASKSHGEDSYPLPRRSFVSGVFRAMGDEKLRTNSCTCGTNAGTPRIILTWE